MPSIFNVARVAVQRHIVKNHVYYNTAAAYLDGLPSMRLETGGGAKPTAIEPLQLSMSNTNACACRRKNP